MHEDTGVGASIIGEDGERIQLRLYEDEDGRFRWYGPDYEDSETSGYSIEDAKAQAAAAWPGDFDLQWYDGS